MPVNALCLPPAIRLGCADTSAPGRAESSMRPAASTQTSAVTGASGARSVCISTTL